MRKFVLAIGTVVFFVLIGVYNRSRTQTFTLSTGVEGSFYHRIGKALAATIYEKSNQRIKIKVVTSEGSRENLERILDNKTDMGIVQNDTYIRISNTKTISNLYREAFHIVTQKDLQANTIRELKGKRIAVSTPGSGTFKTAERVLKHFGVTAENTTFVMKNIISAREDFMSGKLDAVIAFTAIHSQIVSDYLSTGKAKLMSLGDPEMIGQSEISGLNILNPYYSEMVFPATAYPSVKKPILTMYTNAMLVGMDSIPYEVAYQIAEILYENSGELSHTMPVLQEINRFSNDGKIVMQYPYHPGARDYHKRNDPSFYEKYSEFVTLAISGLASMIFFLFSWRQRKKDKIDVYLKEVSLVLNRLYREDMSVEELKELSHDLLEIRTHALDELIDEKLGANESFLIFQNLLKKAESDLADQLSAKQNEKLKAVA